MNENEAVRELTFEEEANLYEEEVREILSQEKGDGESSEINNILRQGMRIIRKAREEIKHARQIETDPVRHGRWICKYDPTDGLTDITCSHCKDTRNIEGCYEGTNGESLWDMENYCPNCGAKME